MNCAIADADFYSLTAIVVSPGSARIVPGASLSASGAAPTAPVVTVVFPAKFDNGASSSYGFAYSNLTAVLSRGISAARLIPIDDPQKVAPNCSAGEVPAGLASRYSNGYLCAHYHLEIDTDPGAANASELVLSAQFTGGLQVIERLGLFTAEFPYAPAVGFQVGVGVNPAGVYVPGGTVPITISRTGGFTGPVTLKLDSVSAGFTGTFTPNPAPDGTATLQLNVPASYASGGTALLRVRGTSRGMTETKEFEQPILALFDMALTPQRSRLTNAAPVDVQVAITVLDDRGAYATVPPAMTLSISSALPPGVTAVFLPDATPTAYSRGRTIERTLRLSTSGVQAATAYVNVIATATGITSYLPGQQPGTGRVVTLDVAGAPDWEYLENGASYELTENDTVGIAMQSNDTPAIAWLEGRPARAGTPGRPGTPGTRKVYVKRSNSTTFNASPSPGPANALVAPVGEIDEARFALTRTDVAKVAFTYADGTGLSIGSAGAAWSISGEFVSGAGQRVRSPRIASTLTGAFDALAVSYIVEEGSSASTSRLFVKRSMSANALVALAGAQPDGALNRDPSGRVLRGTPALALRPNGDPVIAWIEQPADPAQAAAIWVRAYAGNAWGPAYAAPLFIGAPLQPAPLQIAVESTGTVIVSWLEGSPARLFVVRGDVSSGSWLALSNTNNGQGSLNIDTGASAIDHSLSIDILGRIVVAWTEGGANPRLWVKRQNADSTWGLLGSDLDMQTTRTPRIVSDAANRLFLAYTRYYGSDTLLTPRPDTDIFVARWWVR